jgi:branched-chain amino acid transport system substrate-binding protein
MYKIVADSQGSWTFDAVNVLTNAIKAAHSTEPGKIREAILATRKFPGAEGEYNFDRNGDGLRGYNIVRNEKGNLVFDRHIEFPD